MAVLSYRKTRGLALPLLATACCSCDIRVLEACPPRTFLKLDPLRLHSEAILGRHIAATVA